MTQTDRAREALYARLREVLGDEHAGTLMAYLPPRPHTELATKSDVANLDTHIGGLDTRFDGLENRMGRLEARMDGLDTRMDGLETRMIRLEARIDGLDTRMDGLETRMIRLEARIDGLDTRMDGLETGMDQLTLEVREMHGVMRDQLRTYTVTTIGVMTALTAIFSLVITLV